MYRCMGFKGFNEDSIEPFVNEFVYYVSNNGRRCHIDPRDRRVFSALYAPLFMLPPLPDRELPGRILVAIGTGYEPVRKIGFQGEEIKPASASCVWNFEYDHDLRDVNRYFATHERQIYDLFLPQEVLMEVAPPTRLYLRIALPA